LSCRENSREEAEKRWPFSKHVVKSNKKASSSQGPVGNKKGERLGGCGGGHDNKRQKNWGRRKREPPAKLRNSSSYAARKKGTWVVEMLGGRTCKQHPVPTGKLEREERKKKN